MRAEMSMMRWNLLRIISEGIVYKILNEKDGSHPETIKAIDEIEKYFHEEYSLDYIHKLLQDNKKHSAALRLYKSFLIPLLEYRDNPFEDPRVALDIVFQSIKIAERQTAFNQKLARKYSNLKQMYGAGNKPSPSTLN